MYHKKTDMYHTEWLVMELEDCKYRIYDGIPKIPNDTVWFLIARYDNGGAERDRTADLRLAKARL